MSEKVLDNLSVAAARVEIKILQVSGKQMTLSVFKQLPEKKQLERLTKEQLAKIWGMVRYALNGVDAWLLLLDEGKLWRIPVRERDIEYCAEHFVQLFIAV